MVKNIIFFVLAVIFSNDLVWAKGLSLSPGVLSAGGSVYLQVAKIKESKSEFGFHVEPEAEYFVTRSLSLGSSIKVSTNNFVLDNYPWDFGIGLFGKYHFLLSSAVHPYIGLGGNVSWQSGNRPISLSLKFPLGLLVPLNNRIALNIGAPVTLVFSQDGYRGMVIPVGYLGIKAYF